MGGVLFFVYFLRDRFSAFFDAGTQHRFDVKLEAIRNDLDAKSRQINDLRTGVLAARTQRRAHIDQRRIEAIDQLWATVKALEELKPAARCIAVLQWPQVVKKAAEEPRVRQMFEDLAKGFGLDNPPQRNAYDAHAARLFVTPLAWALFSGYRTILSYTAVQLFVLRTGVGEDVLHKPQNLYPVLIEAMPDWKERIERHGINSFLYALEELENRLLSELRRSLEGADNDEAEVTHATNIINKINELDENNNLNKAGGLNGLKENAL